jgi:hypothetical protein
VIIETAPDSPPIVLGTAARLKRSAADPSRARRMQKMNGVAVLKSSTDPQAVTIRFRQGTITLHSGVAPDADLVITLDLADPDVKPKVKGAALHPIFALAAAKVLEPPVRTWQEEAAAFWAFGGDFPRMPRSLLIRCTDDGAELRLGYGDGPPDFEVEGTAPRLRSVFSGDSIITEDWLAGKIKGVGTTEHASVITGRSIAWAMGEGR